MHKFRIFIDEVGTEPGKWPPTEINERYLSLSGVALSIAAINGILRPDIDALKIKHFGTRSLILHRRKIVHGYPPFEHIKADKRSRDAWGNDFVAMLRRIPFIFFTVTLDRLKWREKYPNLEEDPYHVVMFNLLERYFYFLRDADAVGNVMIESRDQGGPRDKRLKEAYVDFYTKGPWDISGASIQQRLTSKELSVVPKRKNIAGLQLADMLAHPALKGMLVRHKRLQVSDVSDYQRTIIRILEAHRYYRSDKGEKRGYGQKMRP